MVLKEAFAFPVSTAAILGTVEIILSEVTGPVGLATVPRASSIVFSQKILTPPVSARAVYEAIGKIFARVADPISTGGTIGGPTVRFASKFGFIREYVAITIPAVAIEIAIVRALTCILVADPIYRDAAITGTGRVILAFGTYPVVTETLTENTIFIVEKIGFGIARFGFGFTWGWRFGAFSHAVASCGASQTIPTGDLA